MKNIKAWLDDHPAIKQILLYSVILFHIVIYVFVNVFVFLTNDIKILLTIIIVNSLIILQWYLCGDCILTPLEHILGGKQEQYDDRTNMSVLGSFIYNLLPEFLKPVLKILLSISPWLAIVFASYKVYISKTTCPPRR